MRNDGLNFGPLETETVQSHFPQVVRTPKILQKCYDFGKKYEKMRKIGEKLKTTVSSRKNKNRNGSKI